jgi:hypothetical protein
MGFWWRASGGFERFVAALVLAMTLVLLFRAGAAVVSWDPSHGDFADYLGASLRVRSGGAVYDLERARTYDGFLYPPPAMLLFLPLSFSGSFSRHWSTAASRPASTPDRTSLGRGAGAVSTASQT